MTSSARIRALAMPIYDWQSSSPREPRSRSTSRAASNAMRSGESWRGRKPRGSAPRRGVTTITRRGGAGTAVIEDDGRGFDPAAAREDRLGLLGMRERVELLEGKLTVESSPETGTTLVA